MKLCNAARFLECARNEDHFSIFTNAFAQHINCMGFARQVIKLEN